MERNLRSCFSLYKCVQALLLLPFATLAKDAPIKHGPVTTRNAEVVFIQNVGQIISPDKHLRKDIDYKLGGADASVFIGKGQLQYVWYQAVAQANSVKPDKYKLPEMPAVKLYSLDVILLGSNKNAIATSSEEQAYYENYYLPYCDGKVAHSFRKITYKNIYPSIDWVLYTNGDAKGFKYDFIVHPGGKVSDIKIQYNGATSVKLADGSITVTTPSGTITEQKPYTFDAVTKEELPSRYVLNNNVMTFDVTTGNREIVIDPQLNWGSYFGDPQLTKGICTAADSFGNSFLCGVTDLANNVAPLFGTVHQSVYGGGVGDGFIAQFNNAGGIGTAQWRTYYGGNDYEQITSATCDLAGNLYITGFTLSTTGISAANIVGGGATQQMTNGGASGGNLSDAFLVKLSNAGVRQWGTYIGGSAIEQGLAIACDNDNNVFVGGLTTGNSAIATSDGYQTTPGEGFAIKYSTLNGIRKWGTYTNGAIYGIAADNKNSVYVGGSTTSLVNIATTGAHKFGYGTGTTRSGYIIKLRNSTGKGVWGTYYGGEKDNGVLALACDSLYNVYVGGTTNTDNTVNQFIASTGALITTLPSAGNSGFLAKLDSSGKRAWGTYYPGFVNTVLVGPDNKLYIAGTTYNTSDIATPGAHQSTWQGPAEVLNVSPIGFDAFLGKFNWDGKRLWGTYYGGPSYETNITASLGTGKVYVAGTTESKSGIATVGTWMPAIAVDTPIAFIGQFQDDTNVFIKFPFIDTILCAGNPLAVKYGVTNKFKPGNVFTAQLSNAAGSFASAVNIGTSTSIDRGTINCTIPATTPEGTGYKIRVISSSPVDTFYNYNMPIRISVFYQYAGKAMIPVCEGNPLQILDTNMTGQPLPPGLIVRWKFPSGFTTTGYSIVVPNSTAANAGKYYVEAENHGCITRDTVNVTVVTAPPSPTIIGDTSLCIGDTLTLEAVTTIAGSSFVWLGPKGTPPPPMSKIFKYPNADLSDEGTYKVSIISPEGCASAYVARDVTVHSLPHPQGHNNTPKCVGDTLQFNVSDTIPNVTYKWVGPNGFSSTLRDNVIPNGTMDNAGTYTVTTTSIHGCQGTYSMPITVKPLPNQVDATNNGPTCSSLDLQLIPRNGTPGANYTWTGPNNYSVQSESPVISNIPVSQQGIYKVVVDLDGCRKEDTTYVTVYQSPDTPIVRSNSPLKTGGVLKLLILNPQAGASYFWTGPNGFRSQFQNPVVNSVIPAYAGIYKATVKTNICSSSDTTTVVINPDTAASPIDPMVIFPNPNNGTFNIKGGTKTDMQVQIIVYASDGKEVFREYVDPVNKKIDHVTNITGVANGVYRLKLVVDGKMIFMSFTIKV